MNESYIYEAETVEDLALAAEFDAKIWAAAFVGATARVPAIAHDAETMLAWFATAIMAGYDRGRSDSGFLMGVSDVSQDQGGENRYDTRPAGYALREAAGWQLIDRYVDLALGTLGAIHPTPEDRVALAEHLGLEAARWINARYGLGLPDVSR